LSPEEVAKLWTAIPKDRIIQYKLKVDLSQEVLDIAKDMSGGLPERGSETRK